MQRFFLFLGVFAGLSPVAALLFVVPAWLQTSKNSNAQVTEPMAALIIVSNTARTPAGLFLLTIWIIMWMVVWRKIIKRFQDRDGIS